MKTPFIILLFLKASCLFSQYDKLIFKQVGYSFIPTITSRYFYFTQDGLMWFSTANGITSFDGSEIVHYTSIQQAAELGINDITCITEDNQHNLYIKGNYHLVYFNRKNNTFHIVNYTLNNNPVNADKNITCMYVDKSGLVYTGTTANGLYIYNPETKTCNHINLNSASTDTCCEN